METYFVFQGHDQLFCSARKSKERLEPECSWLLKPVRTASHDNLGVTRSIWHQVLGNCKAEASAKPVPMDSHMAEDLLRWRRQSIYASDDDYVFASETMRGKQPFWPDNLMKREISPDME